MKRRVPGRILEVALPNYREAMPLVRSLPYVKSLEVSGEVLRVLIARDEEYPNAEAELTGELASAGFKVEHVRSAPTDLEMAFATLIPTAGAAANADDDEILAVAE
jgi:hypothetical protein